MLLFAIEANAAVPIHFHTDEAGLVSLALYRADGSRAVQLLTAAHYPAGDHTLQWNGQPLPPGSYTWRALVHHPFTLDLFGSLGDFGGDRGVPSAAAADAARIYLGWSLASGSGDSVVACKPAGAVLWSHHRGEFSGCRALAVDAGILYVLGGEGADAEGRSIYKLNATTGAPVPWPDGRIDLNILSLWPAKGNYKVNRADAFAVRNGHIYLSFTAGQFIAVVDAKTGAYLQTLVGAPPGALDAVATQSDVPGGEPGKSIDADFIVAAFAGNNIGTILMAHNPIWVLGSDTTLIDPGNLITALAIIGDGQPHHARDIFLALTPSNQIQARPVLEIPILKYLAGAPGGRPPAGPWDATHIGQIRALALDRAGQLWVAEGEPAPKRISVWSTDTAQGQLIHEYFAPPFPGSPIAIDPRDPTRLYADGCQWQLDPKTHRATCRNVLCRNPVKAARFAVQGDRSFLIISPRTGSDLFFEETPGGQYKPCPPFPIPAPTPAQYSLIASSASPRLASADGLDLGPFASRVTVPPDSTLTQAADGSLFLIARYKSVQIFKVRGVDSIHPLASGQVTLP